MKCLFRILAGGGLVLAAVSSVHAQTGTSVACCTAAAAPPVAPILPTDYLGWTNAFRLENEQTVAVLVPDIGRLVHFAPREGISPFRLEASMQGKRPAADERFFNIGGDWFWPVAQPRWNMLSDNGQDWPPPAVLSDLPWSCSAWTDAGGAQCALLTREYGPPLNILASRLYRLEPGSSALVVQQRIERTGDSDVPVVLWNISQIARAVQIALPVEKHSKFRGGLKVLMGSTPDRKQLSRCNGAVIYRVAPGAETKLGSDSSRAWIAAARDTGVIFESVRNTAPGEYPDGGCLVEIYSNEGLGYSEIETLSPELKLEPGTVLENTLRIEISPQDSPPDGCALAVTARTLAGE